MDRRILGFERDEEGAWRALLDCGHKRHLRHDPPRETRPELESEEARERALGRTIDCGRCAQRLIPDSAAVYKSTPVFTQETVPQGLLRNHNLKRGTWGRLVVLEGAVTFHEGQERWVAHPRCSLVILPEVLHHLELTGPVSFRVDFLRATE